MTPDPSSRVIEYVGRLAQLTTDGDIPWARPNPTVFVWEPKPGQRISIQQVVERKLNPSLGRRVSITSYLFQIAELTTKNPSISLDSNERPMYLKPLQDLYQAASLSIDRRAANILDDLLRGLE